MATAIEPLREVVPAPRSRTMNFKIVRSADELGELEAAWLSLDRYARSPMQSFAWIEACAAIFGVDGQIEILVGHDGDEIVAAAPLIARPCAPGGRGELLNYHRVYEPADLVYRNADAVAALARELRRRGRPLVFERLFAASPTIAAMEDPQRRNGWLMVRRQAATPWIALDESWRSPEQKLSSRRRSDFRRASRQAEQAGPVRFEMLSPHEDDVDHFLELAFDVERRSWKGEAGTALADGPAGDFYRRYARSAARTGQLRIEFLHIGRQLAAMQLGVVQRNCYWVLKVGYDPQFHRASPGILLMVEAIKRAVAEGLESYELLGTVEPWIQVWTELERACISLRYYPSNWRGGLALAADLIGKTRRRLARPTK